MKTIAIYLPQFHRTRENDKWWGEGYTEWTAVKSANPLFAGHYQPHIPLNENYYDLLQKTTMEWQAELMHEYQIEGMCFYHYYFKDGKRALDKPAENLLEWKDIDMPFCFSWANEAWSRTWSNLGGNSWNDKVVKSENNKDNNGVLIAQGYGNEDDWIKHFEYLLPFFKDDRYISLDKRPIFLIYKPDDISCFSEMKNCWNKRAKEEGFEGIYFIGVNTNKEGFDAYLVQPPGYSDLRKGRHIISYDEACNRIIRDANTVTENTLLCGMLPFDDTPRRGENGFAVTEPDPERFYQLMKRLYYLSERDNKEYLFVNAWNEWGEGMHLEPDTRFGYEYLDSLLKAKRDSKQLSDKEKNELSYNIQKIDNGTLAKQLLKYKSHYHLLNKWMILKEEKRSIAEFLYDRGIKTVCIYGMGYLGKHVLNELRSSDIEVSYVIDRYMISCQDIDCYRLEDILPKGKDIIIVTPIDEYTEIKTELIERGKDNIVSLSEIIDYCIEKSDENKG